MIPIYPGIIKISRNCRFEACQLKKKDNLVILNNSFIRYGSIVNNKETNENSIYINCIENYDYKKHHTEYPYPDCEMTKRINIIEPNKLEIDETYEQKEGLASTNMLTFFDPKSNTIKGIGGCALWKNNYMMKKILENKNYEKFNRIPGIFINTNDNGAIISSNYSNDILNPNMHCPYKANGLYLYEHKNNNFTLLKKKPIISGLHPGRHDGAFGCIPDYKTIKKSEGGITEFDSILSVLYDKDNDEYILYCRANLAMGVRYIQYAKSSNLIDFGSFNLITLKNNNESIFSQNYYYPNFFDVDGLNVYVGILKYHPNNNDGTHVMTQHGHYKLVYSVDYINWSIIGSIADSKYSTNLHDIIISGKPIQKNNKHYFYMREKNENTCIIASYYFESNRFSYIESENNNVGEIIFNKIKFEDKIIKLNLKINNNGYISAYLMDNENKIIHNCKITEEVDDLKYILNFGKNIDNINDLFLKLEIKNAEIFGVYGKMISI